MVADQWQGIRAAIESGEVRIDWANGTYWTRIPSDVVNPRPAAPLPATGGGGAVLKWSDYPLVASRGYDKNGQRFVYTCPPNGAPSIIFGTDIYTDDSPICPAAVHAGLITFASGGTVTVEVRRPGVNRYTASSRNGVTSRGYDNGNNPSLGAFVFVGAPARPPAPLAPVSQPPISQPSTRQPPPLPPNSIPTRSFNSLTATWYVMADPNRRARIEQSGASLVFYNEFGQSSTGHFDGRDMVADQWQGIRAKIESGEIRIDWANGTYWSRMPSDVGSRRTETTPPTGSRTPAPPPPSSQPIRYLGCFRDTDDFKKGGYDLDGYLTRSASNTPENCAAQCRQRGFRFAGLQDGQSCLCGNTYGRYGQSNACTMPCPGNSSVACGGPYTNSVYSTGK